MYEGIQLDLYRNKIYRFPVGEDYASSSWVSLIRGKNKASNNIYGN